MCLNGVLSQRNHEIISLNIPLSCCNNRRYSSVTHVHIGAAEPCCWLGQLVPPPFLYAGYTQKNGAVSKVNKKFISHLTRAQHTPSAAATVQVSHALPAVCFSCLLWGRGASFQDGVTTVKGFLCAPF
jgi:hypothetical protein